MIAINFQTGCCFAKLNLICLIGITGENIIQTKICNVTETLMTMSHDIFQVPPLSEYCHNFQLDLSSGKANFDDFNGYDR